MREPQNTLGNSSYLTQVLYSLQTELMQLMMSPSPGVSAFPDDGNLLQWTGTISGPDGTFYGMIACSNVTLISIERRAADLFWHYRGLNLQA